MTVHGKAQVVRSQLGLGLDILIVKKKRFISKHP